MSDQAAYDVETILLRLKEIVETGRSMPMSASVLVNREEFIELLDESIATLPQELRHARWLLKEREQFLAQARREADDIIEAGRVRAERMVERTEVVREARRVAQNVIDEAEASGRQLRHEAEDYVDQKLAAFEVVLERTMQAVQKGRERLQVVIEPDQMLPGPAGGDTGDFDFAYDAEPPAQQTPPPAEDAEGAFFDQDARY
jgi:F0F1-type ATP synthase membrane subunit b/b'